MEPLHNAFRQIPFENQDSLLFVDDLIAQKENHNPLQFGKSLKPHLEQLKAKDVLPFFIKLDQCIRNNCNYLMHALPNEVVLTLASDTILTEFDWNTLSEKMKDVPLQDPQWKSATQKIKIEEMLKTLGLHFLPSDGVNYEKILQKTTSDYSTEWHQWDCIFLSENSEKKQRVQILWIQAYLFATETIFLNTTNTYPCVQFLNFINSLGESHSFSGELRQKISKLQQSIATFAETAELFRFLRYPNTFTVENKVNGFFAEVGSYFENQLNETNGPLKRQQKTMVKYLGFHLEEILEQLASIYPSNSKEELRLKMRDFCWKKIIEQSFNNPNIDPHYVAFYAFLSELIYLPTAESFAYIFINGCRLKGITQNEDILRQLREDFNNGKIRECYLEIRIGDFDERKEKIFSTVEKILGSSIN